MHPARAKRATSRYRQNQGFGQRFTINDKSPQADGLVFWLPFTDIRGQAKHIDLMSGLVLSATGSPVWINDNERGWVMEFDTASSQYLSESKPAILSDPFCISAWVKPFTSQNQTILGITDQSTFNQYYQLNLDPSSQIRWTARNGAVTATVDTVASASSTSWSLASCNEYAVNDRAVYINGGGKVTTATNIVASPTGLDITSIGARRLSSAWSYYFDGQITDVRIYNRALSDQEVYELYKNPWDLFKPIERQVWVSTSALTEGEVTWGHDTGVVEANIRDFSGNWTGTGTIAGAGDAETICLEAGEYMISEVVNTGAYTVHLFQNLYDGTGDDVDLDYRHGATEAACEAAAWNNYTVPVTSLGYFQVRLTSTL